MDRDDAIKAARGGAYAAFISAGMTALLVGITLMAGAADGVYGLLRDPMNLLDVALVVGLGVGTLKKSRAAAIALVAYWLIASLSIVQAGGVSMIAAVALRLVFLYFFARAVQGTFVYHRIEKATNAEYKPPPKLMYWIGIPAAALAVAFMTLGLLAESDMVPPTTTISGAEIPDHFRVQLVETGVLMPDESIEYFYSSGVLSVLEEGNVLTDRRVLVYWRNEEDGIDQYDMYFDEIAEVRVLHNGQGLELSEFQVTGHDPELWLILQLAPDGAGDKRFLRALRRKVRDVVPAGPDTVEFMDETA